MDIQLPQNDILRFVQGLQNAGLTVTWKNEPILLDCSGKGTEYHSYKTVNQPENLSQHNLKHNRKPSAKHNRKPSAKHICQPSPTQISQPSAKHIRPPSPKKVPTQICTLITTQIRQRNLTQIHQPSPTQIHQPSPTQIRQPSPAKIHQPSPTQIRQPSPTQIRQPSPTHIHQLSFTPIRQIIPTQIRQQSPAQTRQPSPTQIRQPSPTQIRQPSPAKIRQPSPTQIRQLSPTQIRQPSPTHIRQLSSTPIRRIIPTQIRQQSPTQVRQPSLSPIRQIIPTKIRQISPTQICQTSPTQIRQRNSNQIRQPIPTLIRQPILKDLIYPSSKQIFKPSPTKISQPSRKHIRKPSPTQIRATQIHQQSLTQIRQPSPTQIHQQSPTQVHQQRSTHIHTPNPKHIRQPSPTQIRQPRSTHIRTPKPKHIRQPSPRDIRQPSPTTIKQSTRAPFHQEIAVYHSTQEYFREQRKDRLASLSTNRCSTDVQLPYCNTHQRDPCEENHGIRPSSPRRSRCHCRQTMQRPRMEANGRNKAFSPYISGAAVNKGVFKTTDVKFQPSQRKRSALPQSSPSADLVQQLISKTQDKNINFRRCSRRSKHLNLNPEVAVAPSNSDLLSEKSSETMKCTSERSLAPTAAEKEYIRVNIPEKDRKLRSNHSLEFGNNRKWLEEYQSSNSNISSTSSSSSSSSISEDDSCKYRPTKLSATASGSVDKIYDMTRSSPVFSPMTSDVRYLKDIRKFVRDALNKLHCDEPHDCPHIAERYSAHVKQHHRAEASTETSPKLSRKSSIRRSLKQLARSSKTSDARILRPILKKHRSVRLQVTTLQETRSGYDTPLLKQEINLYDQGASCQTHYTVGNPNLVCQHSDSTNTSNDEFKAQIKIFIDSLTFKMDVDKARLLIDLEVILKQMPQAGFHDAVIKSISEELDKWPVNDTPERLQHQVKTFAYAISSSVPRNNSKKGEDKFENVIKKWVSTLQYNPGVLVDNNAVIETIAKSLKNVTLANVEHSMLFETFRNITFDKLNSLPLDDAFTADVKMEIAEKLATDLAAMPIIECNKTDMDLIHQAISCWFSRLPLIDNVTCVMDIQIQGILDNIKNVLENNKSEQVWNNLVEIARKHLIELPVQNFYSGERERAAIGFADTVLTTMLYSIVRKWAESVPHIPDRDALSETLTDNLKIIYKTCSPLKLKVALRNAILSKLHTIPVAQDEKEKLADLLMESIIVLSKVKGEKVDILSTTVCKSACSNKLLEENMTSNNTGYSNEACSPNITDMDGNSYQHHDRILPSNSDKKEVMNNMLDSRVLSPSLKKIVLDWVDYIPFLCEKVDKTELVANLNSELADIYKNMTDVNIDKTIKEAILNTLNKQISRVENDKKIELTKKLYELFTTIPKKEPTKDTILGIIKQWIATLSLREIDADIDQISNELAADIRIICATRKSEEIYDDLKNTVTVHFCKIPLLLSPERCVIETEKLTNKFVSQLFVERIATICDCFKKCYPIAEIVSFFSSTVNKEYCVDDLAEKLKISNNKHSENILTQASVKKKNGSPLSHCMAENKEIALDTAVTLSALSKEKYFLQNVTDLIFKWFHTIKFQAKAPVDIEVMTKELAIKLNKLLKNTMPSKTWAFMYFNILSKLQEMPMEMTDLGKITAAVKLVNTVIAENFNNEVFHWVILLPIPEETNINKIQIARQISKNFKCVIDSKTDIENLNDYLKEAAIQELNRLPVQCDSNEKNMFATKIANILNHVPQEKDIIENAVKKWLQCVPISKETFVDQDQVINNLTKNIKYRLQTAHPENCWYLIKSTASDGIRNFINFKSKSDMLNTLGEKLANDMIYDFTYEAVNGWVCTLPFLLEKDTLKISHQLVKKVRESAITTPPDKLNAVFKDIALEELKKIDCLCPESEKENYANRLANNLNAFPKERDVLGKTVPKRMKTVLSENDHLPEDILTFALEIDENIESVAPDDAKVPTHNTISQLLHNLPTDCDAEIKMYFEKLLAEGVKNKLAKYPSLRASRELLQTRPDNSNIHEDDIKETLKKTIMRYKVLKEKGLVETEIENEMKEEIENFIDEFQFQDFFAANSVTKLLGENKDPPPQPFSAEAVYKGIKENNNIENQFDNLSREKRRKIENDPKPRLASKQLTTQYSVIQKRSHKKQNEFYSAEHNTIDQIIKDWITQMPEHRSIECPERRVFEKMEDILSKDIERILKDQNNESTEEKMIENEINQLLNESLNFKKSFMSHKQKTESVKIQIEEMFKNIKERTLYAYSLKLKEQNPKIKENLIQSKIKPKYHEIFLCNYSAEGCLEQSKNNEKDNSPQNPESHNILTNLVIKDKSSDRHYNIIVDELVTNESNIISNTLTTISSEASILNLSHNLEKVKHDKIDNLGNDDCNFKNRIKEHSDEKKDIFRTGAVNELGNKVKEAKLKLIENISEFSNSTSKSQTYNENLSKTKAVNDSGHKCVINKWTGEKVKINNKGTLNTDLHKRWTLNPKLNNLVAEILGENTIKFTDFQNEVSRWFDDIPEIASFTQNDEKVKEKFCDILANKLSRLDATQSNSENKQQEMFDVIQVHLDYVLNKENQYMDYRERNYWTNKLLNHIMEYAKDVQNEGGSKETQNDIIWKWFKEIPMKRHGRISYYHGLVNELNTKLKEIQNDSDNSIRNNYQIKETIVTWLTEIFLKENYLDDKTKNDLAQKLVDALMYKNENCLTHGKLNSKIYSDKISDEKENILKKRYVSQDIPTKIMNIITSNIENIQSFNYKFVEEAIFDLLVDEAGLTDGKAESLTSFIVTQARIKALEVGIDERVLKNLIKHAIISCSEELNIEEEKKAVLTDFFEKSVASKLIGSPMNIIDRNNILLRIQNISNLHQDEAEALLDKITGQTRHALTVESIHKTSLRSTWNRNLSPQHIYFNEPIVDKDKMNELLQDLDQEVSTLKNTPGGEQEIQERIRKKVKEIYGDLAQDELRKLESELYKNMVKDSKDDKQESLDKVKAWIKNLPPHIKPSITEDKMDELLKDFTQEVSTLKDTPDGEKEIRKKIPNKLAEIYGNVNEDELKKLESELYHTMVSDNVQNTSQFVSENFHGALVDWLKLTPLYKKASPEQRKKQEEAVSQMALDIKQAFENTEQTSTSLDDLAREAIKKNLKNIIIDPQLENNVTYLDSTANIILNYLKGLHMFDDLSERTKAPVDLVALAVDDLVSGLPIEADTIEQQRTLKNAKIDFEKRLKLIRAQLLPSSPQYAQSIRDEGINFLQNNLIDLSKQEDACSVKQIADNFANVLDSVPISQQDNVSKLLKSPMEKLYEFVEVWCDNLPIQEDPDKTNEIKQNLASKLTNRITELNLNPDILNDEKLYTVVLQDEIDQLLICLPINEELDKYLPALNKELISEVLAVRQIMLLDLAGKAYRLQLRDTVHNTLPLPYNLSTDELAELELLKNKVADAFINLHYLSESSEQKCEYANKIKNEIKIFCNDILRQYSCLPMNITQLKNDLYKELLRVPIPRDDSMKSEVEQVQIRNIINNWMRELPLRQELPPEKLHRYKLAVFLAKRLHDIEAEKEHNSYLDVDPKMNTEITKFFKNLPLNSNGIQQIPELTDKLISKLKNTKDSRKFISVRRSRSANTADSDSRYPCTLTDKDKTHLKEIRNRVNGRNGNISCQSQQNNDSSQTDIILGNSSWEDNRPTNYSCRAQQNDSSQTDITFQRRPTLGELGSCASFSTPFQTSTPQAPLTHSQQCCPDHMQISGTRQPSFSKKHSQSCQHRDVVSQKSSYHPSPRCPRPFYSSSLISRPSPSSCPPPGTGASRSCHISPKVIIKEYVWESVDDDDDEDVEKCRTGVRNSKSITESPCAMTSHLDNDEDINQNNPLTARYGSYSSSRRATELSSNGRQQRCCVHSSPIQSCAPEDDEEDYNESCQKRSVHPHLVNINGSFVKSGGNENYGQSCVKERSTKCCSNDDKFWSACKLPIGKRFTQDSKPKKKKKMWCDCKDRILIKCFDGSNRMVNLCQKCGLGCPNPRYTLSSQ